MAFIRFSDDGGLSAVDVYSSARSAITADPPAVLVGTGMEKVIGSAFARWTPRKRPVQQSCTKLSTGGIEAFRFRDDYIASFEIHNISGDFRMQKAVQRLIAHLEGGGTCTLYTEDASGRMYPAVGLLPGSEIRYELEDEAAREYLLALTVIEQSFPATYMLCDYSSYTSA